MLPFWAGDSHRLRALLNLIISSWINGGSCVACGAQKRLLSFRFFWFWFFRLRYEWRRACSTQQLCKQSQTNVSICLGFINEKMFEDVWSTSKKGLCSLMLRVQLKTRRKRWFAPDWAFERKSVLSKGCLQLAKHWQLTTHYSWNGYFKPPSLAPLRSFVRGFSTKLQMLQPNTTS